jgi:Ni/Co efflux regulator RcnB
MKPVASKLKLAFALALGGILTAGPVLAEKPSWAGGNKGGKNERVEQRDERGGGRRDDDAKSRRDGPAGAKRDHFEQRHRDVVREYYGAQFSRGRCPPGLAKKHNGCMPPGLAKKWVIGRPLPRDVIYYSVPQPLVVQFGVPPRGYRYVRVASDILMIAIGTGMVIDAIQDLGR